MSEQPTQPVTAEDLRKFILDVDDLAVQPVQIPEWGITVYVKSMSAIEREKYLESIRRVIGAGTKQERTEIVLRESSAKLVAIAACDEDGNALFTEGDVAALAKKSAKAMRRIVDAAAKLNNLDEEAEERAKNDSGATETASSSSV